MAKFFISYSRVDKAFTKAFVERLQRKFPMHEFWYDVNLTGGDDWWKSILIQIDEADIFIYLLSNESVTSPYCRAEFQEARRLRKLIIPVQVRDRTVITGDLSAIQYVDMTAGVDNVDAQDDLTRALTTNLNAIPPRRPRALDRTPTAKPDITPEAPRPPDSPTIDTPSIQISTPGLDERTRTIPKRLPVTSTSQPQPDTPPKSSSRSLILSVVLVIAVLVVFNIPTLLRAIIVR